MGEEYQEIDLLELIGIVLRKWWIILIFVVIAGGTAYFVTDNYVTPTYEAKATLFIGKEADLLGEISLSELQMDNKLVIDYRELLRTRLVTEDVINELGLSITTGDLIDNLAVETISDSRFIHIKYVDTNPTVAQAITNKLSEVLVDAVTEIIGIKNVQIVDAAIKPQYPIGPNIVMNISIAVVLGGMLALFVIFILHLLDNTIKKEEQLEKKLGIPVLGVIPKHKEGN